MEEGTAQPDKDDGQMAEVSREDLARDLFKVARVTVEIVSIGVEVPNPGGGFGTFGEAAIEVSRLAEQLEANWNGVPVNYNLCLLPTLWWADGHREVPRGTESRWRSTPGCVGPMEGDGRNRRHGHGHQRERVPRNRETACHNWGFGAPGRGPLAEV